MWMFRRRRQPGAIALTVLALLAVERFLVEILRAKDDRFFGPFTLAQVISLAVLAVLGVVAWLRRGRPRRRGRHEPRVTLRASSPSPAPTPEAAPASRPTSRPSPPTAATA